MIVCFTHTERPYWWTRFLKSGFSHVYIIQPVQGGAILTECDYYEIRQTFIPNQAKPPATLDKPAIAVKISNIDKLVSKRFIIQAFTCVEVTKGLLGITRWNIWTPYQLFNFLVKKHDVEIFYFRGLEHENAKGTGADTAATRF